MPRECSRVCREMLALSCKPQDKHLEASCVALSLEQLATSCNFWLQSCRWSKCMQARTPTPGLDTLCGFTSDHRRQWKTTILPSRRRRVDDTRQISGQPHDYFVRNESLMIRSREKVAWNSGWIHFKKTFEKLKWQMVHITTKYDAYSSAIINVKIKYTIQQNVNQF